MQVGLKKYASVSPSAFGLVGRKRIAVIRSAGAIVGGAGYATHPHQHSQQADDGLAPPCFVNAGQPVNLSHHAIVI